MSHTLSRLVVMANQIGRAFGHRKHDDAVTEVAAHIKSFWEKRMLAQIYAHIDAGGDGLDAVPKEGLEVIRKA